jgi:glycosyltransferase involved in cell wall biosynthesis
VADLLIHVLHISCDFPDALNSQKTPAVANLIRQSPSLQHTVISLNRTAHPGRSTICERSGNVYSVSFLGLAYGIGLRHFLAKAADRVLEIMQRENLQPDIIHAHKLSFEGPITYTLSRSLGIPMAVSVRGDTDFKVLRVKRTYREKYREILRHSRAAFFIAPWAQRELAARWPDAMPDHSVVLPNIVDLDFGMRPPAAAHSERLVMIGHVKDFRRKNFVRLIEAVDQCRKSNPRISLDIIGSGSPEAMRRLQRAIDRTKHPAAFCLRGHLPRNEIEKVLPEYAALVLPSYPETFGMVYLEALHAGIPIIHSSGAGVDGYFDGQGIAVAVDPGSVDSIAAAILTVLEEQRPMKERIRTLTDADFFRKFDTASIVQTYESTISTVLSPDFSAKSR